MKMNRVYYDEELERAETLFLRAESLIESAEYAEAKSLLYEVLDIVPDYAKAHNYLGWLSTHILVDYDLAERHLKYGIKFDPLYPASFANYAILLLELNRWEELEIHLNVAIDVPGIDRAHMTALTALVYEVKRDYVLAYRTFEKAEEYSLNADYINHINSDKNRLKMKMSFIERLKVECGN